MTATYETVLTELRDIHRRIEAIRSAGRRYEADARSDVEHEALDLRELKDSITHGARPSARERKAAEENRPLHLFQAAMHKLLCECQLAHVRSDLSPKYWSRRLGEVASETRHWIDRIEKESGTA
ncbi:hypothetical protein [Luteimonas terrae]|uniref:Uncharacterized protein n=1 Tax=Luteimonas terrae TaxID=1530191 RepID=A0ABU1XX92_9GAMM|nr:hypothetical protein [Luteimonas terrae]MDR7193366.1 hypothetical protein [Luteimonas terrae]